MIRHPRHFFPLVLGLAILLATLEAGAGALRAHLDEVGQGTCWIWAKGIQNSRRPVAFYAVRDFELGAEFASDTDSNTPALLTIAADESYIVSINGRRIGSGAYREGAGADLYDVTAELEKGLNRLAVELASGRGAGGLFARLSQGDRLVVETDDQWRIHRRYHPGIQRGWRLPEGEAAKVWQRHPTGRWRLAQTTQRAISPIEIPESARIPAKSLFLPWDPDAWPDLASSKISFSSELGPWVVLDWGRMVTGFLHLDLAGTGNLPGLLHVSEQIPDRDAPADGLVIPVPGNNEWTDSVPRTFRYLLLTGVPLSEAPVVLTAPAEILGNGDSVGVFGIHPPLKRSLPEEIIRRRYRPKT